MLVHCLGPDNFILFNFCKQILQTLYTSNLTDVPLSSSYCPNICNSCFVDKIHVFYVRMFMKYLHTIFHMGTVVAQWLRCCATNRKFAGSIPDGVIDIILPIALWPLGRLSL